MVEISFLYWTVTEATPAALATVCVIGLGFCALLEWTNSQSQAFQRLRGRAEDTDEEAVALNQLLSDDNPLPTNLVDEIVANSWAATTGCVAIFVILGAPLWIEVGSITWLGWVAAKGAEYALGTAVVFLLTTPLDMLLGRITLRRLEMRVGDGENAVQKVRLRINYRQGKDLQDRLHPYEAAEKRLREIKKRLRDHRNELTESKQLVLVKGGRENIVEQYNAEIARVQNQMMRVSELFATVRGEHCRAAGLVDLTALLRRVPDMPTLDDSPSEEAIGGDIELLRVHMGEIQAIRQDAEACTQKWSRGGFVRPGSGQSPPIQEQEAHNAQRIDSVTRRLRAREDHLDRMADQLEVHRLRLANPATDLGALRQDLSVIVENLRDQSPPSDAAGQIDSPMPAPSSLGLMAADLRDELEDLGSDLNAHLAAIQEVESLGES